MQIDDKCIRFWRELGTSNRSQIITKHFFLLDGSIMVRAGILLRYRPLLSDSYRISGWNTKPPCDIVCYSNRSCYRLMDDNMALNRSVMVDDYKKSKEFRVYSDRYTRLTIIPLKIFEIPSTMLWYIYSPPTLL